MNQELGLRAQASRHIIFRDQSQLVVAPDGETRGEEGLEGFYYANTRIVSRFALRVNGQALYPVQIHPARNDLLVAYYQDPRVTNDARTQDRALLVQLTVTAGQGFHLDIGARNHSLATLECELALLLNADFADLEEARQSQDVSKIMPQEVGGIRRQ